MTLNILILGSNGSIGSFLTEYLRVKNVNVLGSSRDKNGICINPLNTNIESIDKILNSHQITHVINCIGKKNIQNAEDMLSNSFTMSPFYDTMSAKEISFINIGSMAEYSLHKSTEHTIIDENFEENPKDLYGKSKLLGTRLSQAHNNLNIITLRLSNVISQHMPPSSLVGALVGGSKNQSDNSVSVNSKDDRRDFIDLRDVSELIYSLVSKSLTPGIYNVGSGYTAAYSEVLRIFEDIVATKKLNQPIVRYENRSEPIIFKLYESAKIKKQTGWSAKYRLAETINWSLNYE
jgi:nucleoside-diphosphate-sugar epimerase